MNRQRMEIMTAILTLCINPSKKTRIMYQTNLSYNQLKNYLTLLISYGFLLDNSSQFATTEKGLRFLDAFARLREALEDASQGALSEVAAKNIKEILIVRIADKRIIKPVPVRTGTLQRQPLRKYNMF